MLVAASNRVESTGCLRESRRRRTLWRVRRSRKLLREPPRRNEPREIHCRRVNSDVLHRSTYHGAVAGGSKHSWCKLKTINALKYWSRGKSYDRCRRHGEILRYRIRYVYEYGTPAAVAATTTPGQSNRFRLRFVLLRCHYFLVFWKFDYFLHYLVWFVILDATPTTV